MEIAICVLLCFGVVLYATVRISALRNDLTILQRKVEKMEKNENVNRAETAPTAEIQAVPEAIPTPEIQATPEIPTKSAVYTPPPTYSAPPVRTLPEAEKNAADTKTPPEKNYESFIGGRIFAVLAAVLIFIGMIFLAATAFTRFGSEGKIAIMFIASAAVTAAGIILILRAKNAFSTAVVGCGLGMILISLMATHFYYDYLSPLLLIVFLIVWGAAVLFLSKKFDSTALIILSHAGLTICFIFCAFGEIGLDLMLRWQFIVFECAASALMIIGGILVNRKYSLSGLVSTAVMLFFTVIAVSASADVPYYSAFSDTLYSWTPDDVTAVFSFGVQFILVAVVFAVACLTLERQDASITTAALIESLFGFVFAVTNFTVIAYVSDYIRALSGGTYAFIFETVMVAVLAILTVFPIWRMRKCDNNGYYSAAAWFLLGTLFITIFIQHDSYPRSAAFEPLLLIPFAFLMLLFYKIRNYRPLIIFSVAAIAVDFIYMIGGGFQTLSYAAKFSLPFTAGYALLYLLYAFALYKVCPKTKREKTTAVPIRIISIFALELCLLSVLSNEFRYDYDLVAVVMFCIIGTIIWCIYANLETQSKVQTVFLLINEGILLAASFAVMQEYIGLATSVVMLIFAAVFALFRVSLIFTKESSPPETIYSAVKVIALFLVAASVFGIETSFIFSIIIMLCGLVYIVGGFALKNPVLRTSGLTVSIIAIIKMAIVDVWETDSIVRVIALITGGVICFVISAIYNKTAKKLKEISLNEDDN
jgi:hypothetical protein